MPDARVGPFCADGITAADSFFVADAPDAMPYGVFVAVEIKPEHVGEFKRVMAIDVAGSRKEERCRRFDLMQVDGSETKFCFYEVYEDEAVTRAARDAARASCTRRLPSQHSAPRLAAFHTSAILLAQALAHHKTLDHYKAWADFKASDAAPVVSQVATKLNSVDFQ